MKNVVMIFAEDATGATAIEYGLMSALIAVAIIGGATALGNGLNSIFASVAGMLPQ